MCSNHSYCVFIYPIRFIMPGICGDFSCDAKRKAIITDKDGSFLQSSPGGVIPEAEWQWGGERAYGINDDRIPRLLRMDLSGKRYKVKDIAPNKGNCIRITYGYQNHTMYP